ncbi:MAG: 6,7-dimethyl-8-ribityllumazine synthase [Candidatus Kerfeldbacteria bacterium]|nr:6,7-dimethyl-8-ribityllumazine synthase [Candidatus Kerfeldbacteria bacterium]
MPTTKRIALVMGSFHKPQIEEMLAEARNAASEVEMTIIEEVWVPGSLEKPLAVKRLLQRDDIDGVAVLGIIERGETKHGLVMGQAVTQALIQLQLEKMKPIGCGILGPEILPEQIAIRLKPYARAAVFAVQAMLKQ